MSKLIGTSGDDRLVAKSSDENIWGGKDGYDTVVFTGDASQYSIESGFNGEYYVTHTSSDGVKNVHKVRDVEAFEFDDQAYTLDEFLTISSENASLQGTDGYDHMLGGNGDDTITPESGDDRIWGGFEGSDTIRYEGNSTDYEISVTEDGAYNVTQLSYGRIEHAENPELENSLSSGWSIGRNSPDGWASDTAIESWSDGFLGIDAESGGMVELDASRNSVDNIYQDFNIDAGETATIELSLRQRMSSLDDTIEIYWDGELIGSANPASTEWETFTFDVEGDGSSQRLELREMASQDNSYGVLIDTISVTTPDYDNPEVVSIDKVRNIDTFEFDDVTYTLDEFIEARGIGVFGSDSDDELLGGSGDDELYGGDGDDFLHGEDGADVLNGGAGNDFADYSRAETGIEASLTQGGLTGEAAGDSYVNIESLKGSKHDDVLWGNEGENSLLGYAGDDVLHSAGGEDHIWGGVGYDVAVIDGECREYEFKKVEDAGRSQHADYEYDYYFLITHKETGEEIRVRDVEEVQFNGSVFDTATMEFDFI